MTHRLEEEAREVSWVETRKITIGYCDCPACGRETPTPTTEQMVEFAQANRGHFMWPFEGPESTRPPGWVYAGNFGHVCPDCAAAIEAALASRD